MAADLRRLLGKTSGATGWRGQCTSTVLPFARSSSFVSMMYAMYQLSRFFSLASLQKNQAPFGGSLEMQNKSSSPGPRPQIRKRGE